MFQGLCGKRVPWSAVCALLQTQIDAVISQGISSVNPPSGGSFSCQVSFSDCLNKVIGVSDSLVA